MKPYNLIFDQSLQSTMRMGVKILRDFPQSRTALLRIMSGIAGSTARRNALRKEGVVVPPLLIVSTTDQCNLQCAGCYAMAQCRDTKDEMTRVQIESLLDQAVDVGCSVIMLAGGEPLLCEDWLQAVASRPGLLGLVFTNGTLLDDDRADWFSDNRNMIPLFSVEGNAEMTDRRRGMGVTGQVDQAIQRLHKRSIPFGLSITTGEHNIKNVASMDFLLPFERWGCRMSIFTEYVPVDDSDELFALTKTSKQALQDFCVRESKDKNMLLIAFPGDETVYDGCLAAGRGFVHISASGEIEPCPFASYSDRNVQNMSLKEALSSPLLHEIRQKSDMLHEGVGGCALRNSDVAIQALLRAT